MSIMLSEPDIEEFATSEQPLGDAKVLVAFSVDFPLDVSVVGVYIAGEFVDAACFSDAQTHRWCSAIRAELEDDASMHDDYITPHADLDADYAGAEWLAARCAAGARA